LRLAERVSAKEVGALGKQRHRPQELVDLGLWMAVAKHRKAESRFRDEDIAAYRLEGPAGRISHILVVARRHDAQAVGLNQNLRRAEHVAGRMKAHRHAVEGERRPIADRLRGAGEIFAVAQPHEVECLRCREHGAVARPGMIGVGMGDQGARNRANRVDVKSTRPAA
jgi:hypothetical protein